MNEGKVTKKIISYLKNNGWNILCFDYPQSGTGRNFKPSEHCFSESGNKNKEHIIPDILAVKDGILLFFENKTNFYYDDFIKVNNLINNDCYDESINEFLNSLNIYVNRKYYGIGCFDSEKFYKKAEQYYSLSDFVITVNPDNFKVIYNPLNINF